MTAFLIFCTILLSGCDDLMGSDYGSIFAEIYNDIPNHFINISDNQLNTYPHLQQALNYPDDMIKIPRDEYYQLKAFFHDSYSYIFYNQTYFYVRLFGAV